LPTLDEEGTIKREGHAEIRMRRFSWQMLLAAVFLLGCGEVAPLGRRPTSDQFLTQERLMAMAGPGASRESIRKQFGEPYVMRADGTAMAFCRTETVERQVLTLAVIVPFWAKSSVTYFQIQGVWFDAEGKVIQARLWNGHDGPYGGNPYQSYSVPSREQVLLWLGKEAPVAGR
jgi:hypothetical protein